MANAHNGNLLEVRDLRTYFQTQDGTVKAVDGVTFNLRRGETLGIVGESGSGKSVTNLSIIRLVESPPGQIVSGTVVFDGRDILRLSEQEVRQIRGRRIAMIFQDPMTSLNPFMKISRQLMEMTRLHLGHSKAQAYAHAVKMLETVGIPDANKRVDDYPHQFSGGMRQRVMIAIALSCRPELLIADEPSTALDVTIQAQILELIKTLKQETGTSVILITHDLGVVAGMTDHVVVMYAGKIFEQAPTRELFAIPGNPYTKGLLRSVPDPTSERGTLYQISGLPPDVAHLPAGCPFAPRCDRVKEICHREFPPVVQLTSDHTSLCHFAGEVYQESVRDRETKSSGGTCGRQMSTQEKALSGIQQPALEVSSGDPLIAIRELKVHFNLGRGKIVKAVDGVTLDIYRGETLGLVGESGCGKSTLGRAILRLTDISAGQVIFRGRDLAHLSKRQMREHRRHLQIIFQDPYASLNPRMTVGEIVREPLDTFRLAKGREADQRVQDLMETVGLNKRFIKRYPHEFSGGQRQRIGIARALAVDPDFIVADEPISALDVSIQAQILNLLEKLQREKNLTYLFISHDLRAVRHTANRVAVMYLGKIVEIADAKAIYDDPLMPYTKALISAVPVPDPEVEATRKRVVLEGDVPSPIDPPGGCRFHTRCPYVIEACRVVVPPLVEIKPNHFAACIRICPEQPHIESVAPGEAPGPRRL